MYLFNEVFGFWLCLSTILQRTSIMAMGPKKDHPRREIPKIKILLAMFVKWI